ncbi:TPA: hypothetical protein IGZ64_001809 [Escherichia coli]|nr:hypothetical protein [Escherichia coli]
MPIISGTLIDGAGQPVPDCQILLRALNTTSNVVVTTTASVGTNAGRYRIEAQPARYEVTLAMEGWPPKKVGVIDVYADSPDGTLNDFLTVVNGDYLTPDALKQFEQMAQQVREAAERAELASSGMDAIKETAEAARDEVVRDKEDVTLLAHQVGLDAQSAAQSENHAGDSARQSAESAQASERSNQASADSAASADRSEQNAAASEQNAATSERNAKSSEEASAHSETRAEEHAVRAENAAKTAATDAVAEAVPVAAEQIRGELAEQVTRVEEVSAEVNRNALAAANSEQQAGIHEQGAQQALKEAQDIAKTPGSPGLSAYEIWKSVQPANSDNSMDAFLNYIRGDDGQSAYEIWVSEYGGADTSMDAFLEYMRGKEGEVVSGSGIATPGDVGSYVLGMATGTDERFGDEIEGGRIAPAAVIPDISQNWIGSVVGENTGLTGTWRIMGAYSGFDAGNSGGADIQMRMTLFQRIC